MNSPSGSPEIDGLRNALADKLIKVGCIKSAAIEEAFRAVPRHLFLPGVDLKRVYADQAILTKQTNGILSSSSSQPAIMALMLEQLQLQPGHRVLEIGAGSGYNAGLMRYLVGESGMVVTVDLDEDLVKGAQEHLRSAGLDRVNVVCGDGGLGYAGCAPYDRIILTVGAWDIVPAWWEQLKPGGRIVLPLEIKGGVQKSIAFDKVDGRLESISVTGCSFMTLRGAFARPQNAVHFGPEIGLRITINEGVKAGGDEVYQMLSGPKEDQSSGVHVSPSDYDSLIFWMSLREPGLCFLSAEGRSVDLGLVPRLGSYRGEWPLCWTYGLLGDKALCTFVLSALPEPPPEQPKAPQTIEVLVRSYGESGCSLARRFIEQIKAWDAAGRPSNKGLRIRAYPEDTAFASSTREFVVPKRWTRFVLGW